MKFVSTRNKNNKVSFADAILKCTAPDGGLYVPCGEENLSPWIMYMNETTSFASIAGALTSALLKDEFSPIISEAIATKAFAFEPKIVQLDDNLFDLQLYHGPTGSYKDFGISYLTSCLEHVLLMQNKTATVVAVTNGDTGASLANALKNKKRLKTVLLYVKGSMRGVSEEDFVQNGGNIYPVEVDGNLEDCFRIARELYSDEETVRKYSLTLANTVNVGRLLAETFFYVYAFSRLKNKVYGDILYAMDAHNYGILVAGLYAWKFALPVNGFIVNNTDSLNIDALGNCLLVDAIVPLEKRGPANPVNPSHIERLEDVFSVNADVLKGLVYPAPVSSLDNENAIKEAFKKYGVFIDSQSANAWVATKFHSSFIEEGDSTVVMVSRNHPAYSVDKIKQACGEGPKIPDNIQNLLIKMKPLKTILPDKNEVIKLLEEING